VNTEPVQ